MMNENDSPAPPSSCSAEPSFSAAVKADAATLCRHACEIVCANRWKILSIALAVAVLLLFLMPRDPSLLMCIRAGDEQSSVWAWHLSHWSNAGIFNVGLVLTLVFLARLRHSVFIRRLAVLTFLGSVLSGVTATTIRGLAGRARPDNGLTPGFYGPTLDKRKLSFPSGHTATAFGASIPLAVACPPAGVPLILFSGGVAWSRMEKSCHYPGDILASIALASFFGIPLGLAARRMRRDSTTTAAPAAPVPPSSSAQC